MKCFKVFYNFPEHIRRDFDIVGFINDHKIEIPVHELIDYTKLYHYFLSGGSDNDLIFQLMGNVCNCPDVPYLLFYEFRSDEELKEFWRNIHAKES